MDGEEVAELFSVTGTHVAASAPALPSPAGRKITLHGVTRYRFSGNKIAQERRIYDFPAVFEILERSRLEQDLKLAAAVQDTLLPRSRHVSPYCEAIGASLPCRAIGGDFFEYVDLPSGDFGFGLGDVAGKGVPAALLASMVQGILATMASSGCGPGALLSHVNVALCRRRVESRFATAFYAVLSPTGHLAYSNAGHNPPLLLTDRTASWLLAGGVVLGVFPDAAFSEGVASLRPGDVIVLYSDGVTEAINSQGEEFGEERLLACVTKPALSPAGLLESILDAIHQFSCGAVQNDDITAVVLRFTGTAVVTEGGPLD